MGNKITVHNGKVEFDTMEYMLWFKFFLGLNFFKLAWFLFPFVPDYDNQDETMKNQNQTGLKNFKQKKNLYHNIYNG